jgi:mitochondrial fission protein ELM1
MYLFNNGGSTKSIAAYWHDASASTDIYVNNGTIASGSYVKQDGNAYVVLEEGDMVKMQSEASSTFSTICTFELFKKDGI